MLPRRPLLLLPVLLAACSPQFGSDPAPVAPELRPLSAESGWVDPDAQLRLAASLLSIPDTLPIGPGVATPVPSLQFRAEIESTGDALLRYLLLESGAGTDARHSPYLAALAERDDAPADTNQDGSNIDETLAALRAEYAFRSDSVPLDGLAPSFLLPALVPDRIVGKPTHRRDWAALRAVADPTLEQSITPGQLGSLMRVACSRASRLLRYGRGDLYGATPEEGQLGLLLLEQAVLAESLLLDRLSFDGRSLGAFADPGGYDPEVAPRSFPARLVWRRAAADPRRPEAYRILDRGSDLRDQARLLRGFVELAFLAAPSQQHPLLGRLFRGDPFGRPDLTPSALEPQEETISWAKHMQGLLGFYCSGCHAGTKPEAGFSIESYALTLAGGAHQATNPIVVKGDHENSLLWQVVALANPPVSRRMPDNGPYMGPVELGLVADWIDQGLVEKDPGSSERVVHHGVDGLRIVLANLAHFHRDTVTGLLVERADFDGGRSTLVRPGSTGEVLKALSVCVKAFPDEELALELLQGMAVQAADRLVGGSGEVWESYDIGAAAAAGVEAEVGDAASLFGGLYAAASVLGSTGLQNAARRVGQRLLEAYLIEDVGLRSFPGSAHRRLTPHAMTELVEGISFWFAVEKDQDAPALLAELFIVHKRQGFLRAEWPETGETLGDGVPDSDQDGAKEVGEDGLAPVFAVSVQNQEARLGRGVPVRAPHWSTDVLPLLLPNCVQCHLAGTRQGNFAMDSYAELFAGGDWAPLAPTIVPGQPEASFLFEKVDRRYPGFGVQMPEGQPPLSQPVRAVLAEWIRAGARRD